MTAIICEKSYAVHARYSNFYAGGDLAWSNDGQRMFCLNTSVITVVDVATAQVLQTYGINNDTENTTARNAQDSAEDEDNIYAFALSPNNELLVTSHRSGLLRLWNLTTSKIVKLWKSQHKGPVVKLQFSACNKLICSSGADSTLRIWDYVNSSCLGVLRDFVGPALVLKFHPHDNVTEIYAAGADNAIYCWNYASKKLLRNLRGHLSQVTALSFQNDNEDCAFLVSVARDKVLIVWHLTDNTQAKVVPMYEELEGVCYYNSDNVIVACAKGILKLVNCKTAKMSTLIEQVHCDIKQLLLCKSLQQLAVVSAEQNILIYSIQANAALKCVKQLIGFNDEILDVCFMGENDRFLAVATNSKHIKIYDTANDMNCKIVAGHTDTVMTLTTAGTSNLLLSAGKDFSIILWELNTETFELQYIAKQASSHTSTIGCISFGYNSTATFATVCQDGSMKVWHLQKSKNQPYAFTLKYAALAHDKEVNSVAFSPNNKLLATASQDKTAKIWSSESHATIGTLRGHTRGVWCVRFSPVDQIVLTSSSDCSMRLWSLTTLTCLKRFEQECTVLRAEFIDHGKFIVSAASDGLIKIWNIKTNALVQTLDEHADRVWSLAVSVRSKKHFFSGGADSKLIKWSDVTEEQRNVEIDKRQALLQEEQTLQTLLQQRQKMQKAFVLALKLGKPKVTYKIMNQFVQERDTAAINNCISQLNNDQRVALVEHVKGWSTNSRYCQVSNLILRKILSDLLAQRNEQHLHNTGKLVEVLMPYVQRHFKRVTELHNDLNFLEFIVNCM